MCTAGRKIEGWDVGNYFRVGWGATPLPPHVAHVGVDTEFVCFLFLLFTDTLSFLCGFFFSFFSLFSGRSVNLFTHVCLFFVFWDAGETLFGVFLD